MRKRITVLLALACAAILSSCTKESLMNAYNNQETKIETYINSLTKDNPDIRVEHYKGSHRIVLAEGSGEKLGAKGIVAFYYAAYTFSGSLSRNNLFATNDAATAEEAGWVKTGEDGQFTSGSITYTEGSYDVKIVNMSDSGKELLEGLANGLEGVMAGEECLILFSGKYGFGGKKLGTIPANSALAYHIWVESISNE